MKAACNCKACLYNNEDYLNFAIFNRKKFGYLHLVLVPS